VWIQQFLRNDDNAGDNSKSGDVDVDVDVDWRVRWRSADDLPPGAWLISSPYDAQARYCKKRTTEWTGYKVHLTETCEDDTPNLITDVQTTPATTSDRVMTPIIQGHLADRELLPAEHLVDVGYVSVRRTTA
jgi:transposase